MSARQELDFKRIPQELKLILELLSDQGELNIALYQHINWDRFLMLTVHHRVFPTVYKRLNRINVTGSVPNYVMDSLADYYRKNTFRMLHYSGEMERISQCFSEHHIRLLYLKGPTIGHDLYGDISLRTSGDVDILIPIDQLDLVEEILASRGYEKDDYIKTVLNDWKWRHHHIVYFHPDKKVKLEVHWRLNPGPGKEPGFEELWQRKNRSTLLKHPIYTLGHADLFYFLATHGARHGWSRLRWLVDIKQHLNQRMDFEEVSQMFKEYNSLHIGGQCLFLVSELFKITISDKNLSPMMKKRAKKLAQQAIFYLESMISLHDESIPDHVSKYHKQHLYALMPLRQKVLFSTSFLHPYPEDAETLPLPQMLHFLYFPLRPFLWVWRKSRNHAYS